MLHCAPVTTVLEWSMEEVGQWLDSLGLAEYQEHFMSHEIQGQELLTLGRQDLKVRPIRLCHCHGCSHSLTLSWHCHGCSHSLTLSWHCHGCSHSLTLSWHCHGCSHSLYTEHLHLLVERSLGQKPQVTPLVPTANILCSGIMWTKDLNIY